MKFKKGVTRIVFIFKYKVIKIPNFTYGWYHLVRGVLANIEERNAFQYTSWEPEK
jgi:hypothetical protein